MKLITRDNILEHLMEKHLNLIEMTTLDALFEKNWRENWKISKNQYEEFKKYSVPLIKKIFKCNKKKAINTFDWFMNNFGMKVV